MTREATPEAQMCKLILETIDELPNTARVRSALNMAHNMIDQLVSERDRALEAGRLMTARLDAIAQLPHAKLRGSVHSWLNWDDVKPFVTPSTTEPHSLLDVFAEAVGWSPGDDFDLEMTARRLRESAEASNSLRAALRAFLELDGA